MCIRDSCLDVHLSSSPVSSLSIVTDSVVGSQSNPLWQWSVLLLSLSHFLLDSERLLSLVKKKVYRTRTVWTTIYVSNSLYIQQLDEFMGQGQQ